VIAILFEQFLLLTYRRSKTSFNFIIIKKEGKKERKEGKKKRKEGKKERREEGKKERKKERMK
jgi:hypothetical protein